MTTGECSAPVARGTEPDTHAHPIALSGRKRSFSLGLSPIPLHALASPFRSLPLLEVWKRGEWGREKRSTIPSRIRHIILFLCKSLLSTGVTPTWPLLLFLAEQNRRRENRNESLNAARLNPQRVEVALINVLKIMQFYSHCKEESRMRMRG